MMFLHLLASLLVVAPADTLRFTVAPEGNEARYRVREQLAGINFPNDAVGVTSGITGTLVFLPDGQVDRTASRITVDLTLLKSDRDRRDNFLQRRTLDTAQHPSAVFVPSALRGLSWPLPSTGTFAVELTGDLTIKEVTRPVTWQGTVTAASGSYTGNASTTFRFEEFELEKPRVASVLSVADEIRLEFDFRFVRTGS